ncbi:MAG: putative ABC exporter domain-containing protein, partial [Blautia sp.]
MNSLMYLTFTKIKGMIRNQFRSITSGLITIFTVLLYGGLVIMVFAGSKSYDPELMGLDANLALMAGIGMTALIMLTVLLNSRKALVYDTDAYYLFAGPYNRKQVNFYIMGQSIVHALLYALLGCFMMAMFSMGNFFSVPYFLLALTALWLVLFFFFLLTDYIYM